MKLPMRWTGVLLVASVLTGAVQLEASPAVVVKAKPAAAAHAAAKAAPAKAAPAAAKPVQTEAEQVAAAKLRIELLKKILAHPLINSSSKASPLLPKKPAAATAKAPADHAAALHAVLGALAAHHDGKDKESSLDKLRTVLNNWAAHHGKAGPSSHLLYTQRHEHPHGHLAPLASHASHTHPLHHLPTVNDRREVTTGAAFHHYTRGERVHNQPAWQAKTTHLKDHGVVEATHDLPVFQSAAEALKAGFKSPCTSVHPYFPHCDCNPHSSNWPHCTQDFVPNEDKELNPAIPLNNHDHTKVTYSVDPKTNQPIIVPVTHKTTVGHVKTVAGSIAARLQKMLSGHPIPANADLHSPTKPAPLLHSAAVAAAQAAASGNNGYVIVVDDH